MITKGAGLLCNLANADRDPLGDGQRLLERNRPHAPGHAAVDIVPVAAITVSPTAIGFAISPAPWGCRSRSISRSRRCGRSACTTFECRAVGPDRVAARPYQDDLRSDEGFDDEQLDVGEG